MELTRHGGGELVTDECLKLAVRIHKQTKELRAICPYMAYLSNGYVLVTLNGDFVCEDDGDTFRTWPSEDAAWEWIETQMETAQ